MHTPFDYHTFHRHRKFLKWFGFGLVLLGLFTIVDMMSEVPIPLTGYRAIFAGTVLIIFGMIALYKGYKLPIEEALELVRQRGRGITESELVHEMLVDRVTARRLINALVQKGFLHAGAGGQAAEQVYEPVR
jgi:hypothetical protein